MTVIINELEVVVEQPPQPAAPNGGGAPALQPPDIENVRERQARMRLRTLAH
jgi:hypothetical protein